MPNSRRSGLLEAMEALVAFGKTRRAVADDLAAAYRYLRHVEHRLQMIADHQELPRMEWQMKGNGGASVAVKVDRPAKQALLWSAPSLTRDFRNARWTSRSLTLPAETGG